MLVDERLRTLPEEKKLSQGDIQKRSGLVRSTSLALRTDTRFCLSRHWRSWPVR